MIILSWNCQGLAKPKAVRALRLLLSNSKPDILFLCEVKTHFSNLISKALLSHSLCNHSFVPPLGIAGGLILAWKNSIDLSISLTNPSFIHAHISSDLINSDWILTAVYSSCNSVKKAHFWNSIALLQIPYAQSWLMIGDLMLLLLKMRRLGEIRLLLPPLLAFSLNSIIWAS